MGLLSFFRRKALSATPAVVEALQDRRINPYPALGGTNQRVAAAYQRGIDGSYGWIYSTQPAVRSVIDFIARNTAQLGLKLYERVDDTERERREDHPAAESLRNPDGSTPKDAFIYRLVTDYLVWDNAYVLKLRTPASQKLTLIRLPPNMVQVSGGRFRADVYVVWRYDGTSFSVAPADMLHWFGYNPDDPLMGLSKLETLRQELATDRATQAALVELAKNGLKGGYIKRPLEAPEWDQDDAERFAESWRRAKRRGDGADPILDEGMEYVQTGISPKDAELLRSREFTKEEVAAIYGVPLAALGAEGNTAEERKLVYADVLPPITERLANQLDVSILQAEYNEPDHYFEFDLNEKLRGQPEERFAAMTAAAGRPWRTVNENRAMENLPPVEGGDALTIPLNVMLAGEGSPALPAPNVMPPQDPNDVPQDGSFRRNSFKQLETSTQPRIQRDFGRQQEHIDEAKATLERFYARQARTMKSKAAKAANTERWNRELAADLEKLIAGVVVREGDIYISRLGGEDFDIRQVRNYVKAMSEAIAERLNDATQRDINVSDLDEAFTRARGERAQIAAAGIGTRATVFARQEAAKQAPTPQLRTKTWIANTERHAALDGVAVPLDSDWGGIEPGTEPGCSCTAVIS